MTGDSTKPDPSENVQSPMLSLVPHLPAQFRSTPGKLRRQRHTVEEFGVPESPPGEKLPRRTVHPRQPNEQGPCHCSAAERSGPVCYCSCHSFSCLIHSFQSGVCSHYILRRVDSLSISPSKPLFFLPLRKNPLSFELQTIHVSSPLSPRCPHPHHCPLQTVSHRCHCPCVNFHLKCQRNTADNGWVSI